MNIKPTECQLGEWQDAYSVGNDTLDNQHKMLLKICQRMRKCLDDQTKSGNALFHEILNDLAVYAKLHFRTEEAIMRLKKYPAFEKHVAEHNTYFEWLAALSFEATKGNINKESLLQRVIEWWVEHICKSDAAYRPFLAD